MRVHLVNPNELSFGVGVITPRWLYVLASATPQEYGDPAITDETLEQFDPSSVQSGDVVGIGIHTANACRGYELGKVSRERGAWVIYGGIHATLYPEEAHELGAAHGVVKGDGDVVWSTVLADCAKAQPRRIYDGGRAPADHFLPARWDLIRPNAYMWASVQTVRGCPKHCSFCSVWRTDGQQPRQRAADAVVAEVVQLRRMGYRFITLADDNFYPVTMTDIANARRQNNHQRLAELQDLREERFYLMERLAQLPDDLVFFTQITMEAAEDPQFLEAMRKAHIKGALVGIEAVTPEGLKSIYKEFNPSGDKLAEQLRLFKQRGVHVLGSFIFGLPTDRAATFEATAALAKKAEVAFAQFVMMTPFPGTVDFQRWEESLGDNADRIQGVPVTRYWLIPGNLRPKLYTPHPTMTPDEIRSRTQGVWDNFYSLPEIWKRAHCVKSLRSRLAFVFISKLYRQMYANTGIATDSARRKSANKWARWLAKPCQRLFRAKPMPDLTIPAPPPRFEQADVIAESRAETNV
ncbi:MAG: B12-binding domain-containing radical SAM protein [Acidobacteria bacterium]|nr:B12-binding domain-containing radical SAM protein [Acidobacteriota bacterium]